MGNFIQNIGNTLADNTIPGRMITKGENMVDAHINAYKETAEDLGNALANNTPIGRMATKGENIFEASINSFKENSGFGLVGMIQDFFGDDD